MWMREPSMIMLIVLSAALATPAPAQTGNILSDNYNIMVPEKGSKQKQKVSKREQPEPWLAPKYRSPSGTVQQVHIPKSKIMNPPSATDPGYVYVPQTGRTFQNLPTPGRGTETSQDRATRCAHQAGVYVPDRQRQRLLYGFLPLITDHRVSVRYRPRDESSTAHGKFPSG